MRQWMALIGFGSRRFLILLLAIAVFLKLDSLANAGPIDSAYSITNVASPPSIGATWTGQDAAGEWFGSEFVAEPTSLAKQPITWNNGQLSFLAGNSLGYVAAVNSSGQAVGNLYGNASSPNSPDVNNQAFLYSNGALTNLGTFGYQQSGAEAISGNGQIAIWVRTGSGANVSQNVIIDNSGNLTQVPAAMPNATMAPITINNSGQVLGTFESPATNAAHAFLYSGGKTIDLGALQNSPNLWNMPTALSSNGIVVGTSSTDNTWHGAMGAYIYQNGVTTAIPLYNGNAFTPLSVNAQGQVLGAVTVGSNSFLSMLYNSGTGTFETLNSLVPSSAQWGNLFGQRIDDQGDIFGYSTVNGQQQFFELTPNGPGSEAPVPEPSTWLIFIALSCAGILRKRLSTAP
jgi:probable HAF family extracellular repeat protein